MKLTKLLALVLVFALLLAGCATQSRDDVAGSVQPGDTSGDEESRLALGTVQGGVYTNTYAGFGCAFDSGWAIYGAAELQQLSEDVTNALSSTELGDALADVTQFNDMMAENVDLLASVNVLYQAIDPSQKLAYLLMSESDLADATLAQEATMIASYNQLGMQDVTIEKVTAKFLGQEHTGLRTAATLNGVPVYILQLFDYTLGDYSVTITFTTYVEDSCQTIADMFYAVE